MSITETIKSLGARLTMEADDVRALLERDHDEVKELLRGLLDDARGRSRKDILDTLKTKLTAHSRAEEKVVYDALIRARAKRDVHVLAEEGYVEHAAVDDLLARIAPLQVGSELWLAHAKVIRELLEHHIAEEQNQTFAQLGELFDRDELAAMGKDFLRRKARVLTAQASKTQRNVAKVVARQRAGKAAQPVRTKKVTGRAKAAKTARRPANASRRAASRVRVAGRRTR